MNIIFEDKMNNLNYKNEIISLKNQLTLPQANEASGSKQLQNAIMSASLYNLMPEIDVERHQEIINNILFFQKWAARDQHHTYLLKDLTLEGVIPAFQELREKPTIFCSFHVGSYRLLAPYLISKNIKFTILIDANVAEMQGEDFRIILENVRREYDADHEICRIIDVSKGNVFFTMLKELKRGRSLLVFIDGNTGVDGRSGDREKLADIKFFNHILHSRKGIAYLSHMAKVSITPMLTYRNPQDIWQNVLQFFPPIVATPDVDRDDFVNAALSKIYQILEDSLGSLFEQWESWRYIEKSLAITDEKVRCIELDIDSLDIEAVLKFNANRYILTRIDTNQDVLFDRCSYRANFITPHFMAFFQTIINTRTSIKMTLQHPAMTQNALKSLLEKEILETIN